VQAGRLRLKMAEYYASEGAEDPIQVEVPKGTYVLSFHRREASAARLRASSPSAQYEEIAAEAKAEGKWKFAFLVLVASLIVASAAVAFWLAHNSRPADRASESVPPAFATFWKNFVSGPEEPWVIFSNGAFVGRPETGMR